MWIELSEKEVPKWVHKAGEKFYSKSRNRPYDKIKIFKGNTFIYKIWFECVGQGQIKWHYYKKKK